MVGGVEERARPVRLRRAALAAAVSLGMAACTARGVVEAPPAAPTTGEPVWTNTLQPAGHTSELTLAREGRPLYDILLPTAPTPQERVAADELAHWLGRITGAAFVIRSEADRADGPVISVGGTQKLHAAGLAEVEASLGPEGYAIAVRDRDLLLAGGAGRGPITAVMALLEEDLGCRWYTASEFRIPAEPTLTARVVERQYAPVFELRDPFSFVSNDPLWSLRNRTNAYHATLPAEQGGNLNYPPGWFVHTYTHILASNDENFAACPECFMLDEDGTRSQRQLCPTHPEVAALAIAGVRKVLDANPTAEMVSVSQNDIRGYCHCDRCMALIEPQGTPAAPLLSLVNHVADAVATAHPDVTITTLGYHDTVPAPSTMEPEANVAIRLATDITWSDVFAPAATNETFLAALTGWAKVADRIHIWDYQVNFGDYFQPWPSFHAKAENLRLFARNHVTGVMIQGAYQAPGNERQRMRAWVFAKLLWDPSREVWPLMQDFVRGYYGPAAAPLEAYNRMLYECGLQHQGVIDCIGTDAFVARASRHFDEAEARARAAGDDDVLQRVALARLPVLDMALPLARGRWVRTQADSDLVRYTDMLARFDEVAQRVGARQYSEQMSLADWLEQRRGFVAPPAGADQRTALLADQEVQVYQLPATWALRRDPALEGEAVGWAAADLDVSDWGTYRTDLKTGWEDQGYPGTDGVFWFRSRVTVPPSLDGGYVYLYFRACDEEAWVWVDGQPLGERTAAGTGVDPSVLWVQPFALEATGRLRTGQTQSVVVRVNDSGGMGGLYMPVYVVAADVPLTTEQITEAVAERNLYER